MYPIIAKITKQTILSQTFTPNGRCITVWQDEGIDREGHHWQWKTTHFREVNGRTTFSSDRNFIQVIAQKE